jgi:pyrroloquinoline quinone (PQQ) biosynthesis protein C
MVELFHERLEEVLRPHRHDYDEIMRSALLSGVLSVTYPALLVETFHYVRRSCALMERAQSLLESSPEHTATSQYFAQHTVEERNHEEWVLDDLEALGHCRANILATIPLAETIHVVASQLYVIEYLHPAALLGYVYMMESRPPHPVVIGALHATGVPYDATRFLERHGEADIGHYEELAHALDNFLHTDDEREAAICSAVLGLSNVNRMLQRIWRGDFLTWRPQCLPRETVTT